MSASLKRRRISPDTYVTINGSNHNGQTLTSTPTPKRASYLSPTKASLARSNPQLLDNSASAKKSRESEPNRRQSLRDAILGNRNLLPTEGEQDRQDSENVPSTETIPTEPAPFNFQRPTNSKAVEKENEVPNTPRHHNPDRSSSTQSRYSSTPRRTAHSTRFASPKIVPQLVDSPRRNSGRSASAEVELPPTPVQLGKDKLPDRPRGLSSSSPGGRDKRRAAIRGGNIYSSPLKPRDMAPVLSEDEDDVGESIEIASGLGDDDQERSLSAVNGAGAVDVSSAGRGVEENMAASDMQSAKVRASTASNPDVIKKNQKIENLQEELEALQEESRKLQTLGSRLNKNRDVSQKSLNEDFELVLQNLDRYEPISLFPTDQHAVFQRQSSPYLNLFADPALTMSYETWEKTVDGRQKFVYQTTFAASKPWPADTFTLTLDSEVDWDTDVVEHVSLINDIKQSELSKWIRPRLQNSILRCDAATLVTGTGRFFEASIKRARIWRALIEPQAATNENEYHSDEKNPEYPITSQKEAFSLLPYLFKSQHGFAPPNATQLRTRRSLGSAKQLMLTYDISLDWLGRPEIKTEILMTGFNEDVVNAAKQLYGQVEQVGGVVKALNGVKDILGMSANARENDIQKASATMKTKKAKARRMTVFK